MADTPTISIADGTWCLSTCDAPILLLNLSGEIQDFSAGARQLLAPGEESLRGRPVSHLYAHEYSSDFLEQIQNLALNIPHTFFCRFRVSSGGVLPLKVVARRTDCLGQPTIILTLFDRSVEEQLKKEVARLKGELKLVYQRVEQMVVEQASPDEVSQFEISVLHQISQALLSTIELNKVLYIILTCVTAHPAFGFSRAFLLLVDEENQVLEGKMGVGPRNVEEAHRIWQELSQAHWGLDEFLAQYDRLYPDGQLPLDSVIQRYRQPIRPNQDILVDAVLTKQALQVDDAVNDERVSTECLEILASNHFVVVPLVAGERALGVIVADNLYKDQAVTPWDVRLLSLFANHGAMALHNAATYAKLRQNIQQLREIQEQLIQSERLSAIGEMTAKVAHEIRNPLVTIGGFARSILKGLPADSTMARKCEIMVEETLRLEEILSSLLDFSRQSELKLEYCNLDELIGRSCSLLRDQLQQKKVRVVRDIQKPMPELLLDTNKIQQVLLNLVKNAVEAMPEGGTISFTAHLQGRFVSLKVSDTGEGIPSDIIGNIFNPFFTTKSEGFGLGLAICRTFLYDHGGNVSVTSEVGKGTTFDILLPLPSVSADTAEK